MSATEQKWFIRIVLKEMKLGFGHIKILSLFHPDAKELYDVSNSLVKVSKMVYCYFNSTIVLKMSQEEILLNF